MDQVKKKAKIWLCIAIALLLLSMIVASAVQTSGGKVEMKRLYLETDAGFTMSAYIFVPKTATAENPAPAVVTSHGAFNNKEMQDANFTELSRRGYVVLAIDQPAHGNTTAVVGGNGGVYQGALALSRLPYVDATRIGVTGHSMGGMSCNAAVVSDNAAENQVIASVLLNCADATYVNTTNTGLSDTQTSDFANIYGKRDVGIIACQYDEFFHKSTDENGNQRSSYYFMDTANAQSFLNFGKDPTDLPTRDSYTYYHDTIDGKDTIRIIFRPDIIHPWSHFSAKSTSYTIEFFENTLGAPNPLPANDQVWQWKEAFNLVGLIGIVLFVISFTTLLLYTPFFADLRAKELVKPVETDKKGKLWFWLSMIISAIFAMLIYLPATTKGMATTIKQQESFAISLWAAGCGGFAIVCMLVFYFTRGKKQGMDLAEVGVKMSPAKWGKTLLLALITVCVTVSWVFFADYFFKTDFRFWTLALKAFTPEKIGIALWPYLLLFLVYYVASSVSFNCFNFNTIGGKRGLGNGLLCALFAAAPALIMPWIQYGCYYSQKHLFWAQTSFSGGNPPMYILWLFPMVLILPTAALISRKIYRVTRNPYLAGLINAAIITLMTVTNTRTAF